MVPASLPLPLTASNKLNATILLFYLLAYSSTIFTNACSSCGPKPTPPPAVASCPKDTLKLGACVELLGLVNVVVGTPVSNKCCALLGGLADLEAALCLCTAIKANVLGINLNVPLTLSLLLSACQKSVPPGFQCA
ncbi:14 kDa proline-rich protein DC2.15-like [Quillaja saponaria]|uniref:14 kDa proline-rich protein DC2.15-like n=1 Tax=Quillaja saponaria TaxID=32244 RepID=A0AAD7LIH1_QUISA|nr:14 kDa proline-rich protein DC2.15-like [Quillaja saponaria]